MTSPTVRALAKATPAVQLVCETRQGAVAPLATSRDPRLVRLVAARILAELRALTFEDDTLAALASAEADRVTRQLEVLGLAGAP